MTALALPFDPSDTTDYGTDVAVLTDLDPVWGLSSGQFNYALQAARRITQRRGGHDFYAKYCNPPYQCLDIQAYLNAKMDNAAKSRLQGDIAAVQENDVRTQSCEAAVTFDFDTNTLTVAMALETADGPFDLVVAANAVNVQLLSVNGVSTASLPPIATTAPVTIVVQGGSSAPPTPGPPGPAGPVSRSFRIADCADSSGGEVAQAQTQLEMDLSTLAATFSVKLVGIALSQSSTATFLVRMNGSDNAADGTVVATLTAVSPSFTSRASAGASLSNPGGTGRFIVTVQSSGAGQDAELRNATLVIG